MELMEYVRSVCQGLPENLTEMEAWAIYSKILAGRSGKFLYPNKSGKTEQRNHASALAYPATQYGILIEQTSHQPVPYMLCSTRDNSAPILGVNPAMTPVWYQRIGKFKGGHFNRLTSLADACETLNDLEFQNRTVNMSREIHTLRGDITKLWCYLMATEEAPYLLARLDPQQKSYEFRSFSFNAPRPVPRFKFRGV